jgi:hypothetical protein
LVDGERRARQPQYHQTKHYRFHNLKHRSPFAPL